jgi:hypothetical protein
MLLHGEALALEAARLRSWLLLVGSEEFDPKLGDSALAIRLDQWLWRNATRELQGAYRPFVEALGLGFVADTNERDGSEGG